MNAVRLTTFPLYNLIRLVWFVLLLSACAGMNARLPEKPPPETDLGRVSEAQILLATLAEQNTTLKNFKGIGNIKVWKYGKINIDERIAWIGVVPVKISIAVLISGYPAIKMASDGKWFYYLEAHGDQSIYKKIPSSDDNLKRIISIPIPANDLIMLLAGRIPIREHNSALVKEDPSAGGFVLVLKKKWWGIAEKIYLDEAKAQVRQVELFNRDGSMIYRAVFEQVRDIQGYRVPFRLTISAEEGADAQLDIERYWTNVAITPSMFVLNPPD